MEPLVRASLALRDFSRRARAGHGTVAAFVLGAYVASGGARPEAKTTAIALALGLLGAALFFARFRRKLVLLGDAGVVLDFEIGALSSVALAAALTRYDGGLAGRYYPATYVLVAVMAAFARPLASVLLVCWIVLLEASVRFGPGLWGDRVRSGAGWLEGDAAQANAFGTHAAFACAFAAVNLALLRAEVARVRATARARLAAQLLRHREDARSYRLLGAGESSGSADARADRLARSSVEEIHQSVHYALDLMRRSMNLHTAVLLWLNDSGTHLRISELSTTSDAINDAPFAAGDGVLGAVLAKRDIVSLHALRASFKVPYYVGPSPIRSLSAIPVLDGETLRGVLVIDREDEKRFLPEEEDVAARAARFCLRAIQNERVFLELERGKVEQGKLYRAAQALGAALSEKDVVAAGVRAAGEIASFDAAAVTLFEDTLKQHEVVAAQSVDGKINDLIGIRFGHNTGLVSMVVQNRCPLPYRGEHEAANKVVLSKRLPWPTHPSLLVLPLMLHERALGTLILSARRRHAFGDAVRPTLEVLASHLAVSLSNARMVQKLETMATTDGLTSLFNKRAMLEAGAQKIAAAARFNRRLALLVVDIDHFKRVNDTYGHDVGDVVIRGLGDVLRRQKRATDVVARFGGEEFVALCEQTDEKGAMNLAERIREDLSKTLFRATQGSLSVTCSIGVATLPEAGLDWDALFKAADDALYVSKRSGRNRSTAYRARKPERAAGAASTGRSGVTKIIGS